ncbi:MAG: dihydrofolate reductase [Firmicutes bacterium]|nr:dihydrofolate reductase [Bacillota bacterium]
MLSLILACALDGAIGRKGTLPWHISGDLKHFRELTKEHTILMGRKTFESLPRVLPKRQHIVISADPSFHVDHPQVVVRSDLKKVLEASAKANEEIFVIGGASIYEAALPFADKIYLTMINLSVPDADTFFTGMMHASFQETFEEVSCSERLIDEESGTSYCFYEFKRKNPISNH